MAGFDNDVIYGDNWDFRGATPVTGQATVGGDLPIGSGGSPAVKKGQITSSTLTVSYSDPNITIEAGGTMATTYNTDSGSATAAGNVLTVAGGTGIDTNGSGSTVTVTLETPVIVANGGTGTTTLTDGGIILGSGTNPVTVTSQPTNGQLLIGSTGGDPVLATLASADSSVTITNGAGSIDLSVGGSLRTNRTNGVGTHNLGMSLAAGVTTIHGADGNALSATNPGYITMRSNANAGQLVTVSLTSNKTFNDVNAGSSVFAGSLFDFDTGDTTTVDIPFYLYCILDDADANPIFACSRIPSITASTAATIFDATGGGADKAVDLLTLESVTITSYDANVTQMVGSFSMDINGSDDWAVQSVTGNDLGFGKYAEKTMWTMPQGVYGASASSIFLANGGTAPTVGTGQLQYSIDPWGNTCTYELSFALSGTPATAVDAQLNIPIIGDSGATWDATGWFADGSNIYETHYRRNNNSPHGNGLQCEMFKGGGTFAKWQYDEMAANDQIKMQITYLL